MKFSFHLLTEKQFIVLKSVGIEDLHKKKLVLFAEKSLRHLIAKIKNIVLKNAVIKRTNKERENYPPHGKVEKQKNQSY